MSQETRRTIYETKEAKKTALFETFEKLTKKLRRSINFCILDAMQDYIDKHKEVDLHE